MANRPFLYWINICKCVCIHALYVTVCNLLNTHTEPKTNQAPIKIRWSLSSRSNNEATPFWFMHPSPGPVFHPWMRLYEPPCTPLPTFTFALNYYRSNSLERKGRGEIKGKSTGTNSKVILFKKNLWRSEFIFRSINHEIIEFIKQKVQTLSCIIYRK